MYAPKDNKNPMHTLINKVIQWHHDRNLIDGATSKDQTLKLMSEAGELCDNVLKGRCIKDDVGDMLVVLINICEREGTSLEECLEVAYADIEHRKGRMVNGTFIKEGDAN